MNVEDVYWQHRRSWVRLHEKGQQGNIDGPFKFRELRACIRRALQLNARSIKLASFARLHSV
jgi:hypothetical protein